MSTKLTQILAEREMTQSACSAASGVHYSMMSRIARHGYLPSERVRARLASSLGVAAVDIWPSLADDGGEVKTR